MTRRFIGKRRGNPNWGRPLILSDIPNVPTAFERLTTHLGLRTEQQQLASAQLRDWVRRNFETRYVPEWLIIRFGFAHRYELENVRL